MIRGFQQIARMVLSGAIATVMLAAMALAQPAKMDPCMQELDSPGALAWLQALPTAENPIHDAGRLTPHQQMAREVLAELVNIDTTDADGDNTAAALAVAARFYKAGFAADDVQILAPAPRKGNLIVRLPGSDSRCAPLLLLTHLDVVSADRSAWDRDPFSFVEENGYMYGRGVSDDKDEAAIHIANLLRLRAEGFKPRRDIVIALTSDEEGGDHNGVQWLLRDHPQLLQAALVFNEGGGGVLFEGGRVANEVQATEKGYQTYELVFTSGGGHSSMPSRDNAIVAAGKAMVTLDAHSFPVRLNAVTREFFERSAPLYSGRTRWAMEAILQTPPEPEAAAHLADIPFFNASLRTTCTPTMIVGGHAENALPHSVKVTVNCRLLPTASREQVTQALRSLVGDDVVMTALPANDVKAGISLQADVLDVIEAVSRSVWPDVPTVPMMGPGGTDARFLRSLGIPVYGVNGVFIDVEDDRAHAPNERVRSRSFYEGLEFMYRLIKAMSR